MKGVAALIFLLAVPLAYSISISDLISRFSFSSTTVQMNVTNYTDFMVDRNGNGVNDILVFELTTNNIDGTFIFVINLFDKDGTLTNETNKTLSSGINKLNITFSSILLTQSQFNYSIKVYNSSRRLKYRKDSILTQNYPNYEEGFRILSLNDSRINRTLQLNATINSPENKSHVTTLFLAYNNLTIFSKDTKTYKTPITSLIFNFDNETIKRTHYAGNYTISSVKIGTKTIKANSATAFYDFRDFADSSYVYNFTDNGTDADGSGKFDFLQINASIRAFKDDNYTLAFSLYDLFDNLIESKNISSFLNAGKDIISIGINGSKIYEKKLNGPYVLKSVELFEGSASADRITDAYTTSNYNFNDFDRPDLPDLAINISVSDGYHYGIGNITINFTFKNIGRKHAFNVLADIFDNGTFSKRNTSSILKANSQAAYSIDFANISDFEISAIADLQDSIEELNESNNAEKVIIKLNKKPNLIPVSNITVKESEEIVVNLSASDDNGDNLSFSVNWSRLSPESNIFRWNTTTTESGNYTLTAAASDGFLNSNSIFRISVLDNPEKDIDNDGIEDGTDKLIGDENFVNTSTLNLSIFINSSRNLSRNFNESMKVRLMDSNFTIAEFDFDFSRNKLNLSNITVNKQSGNSTGSVLFRGLKMPEGATKALYLDKTDNAINGVCIKEQEISSISEISSSCSSGNEFLVECDGTLQNDYRCTYNSTLGKYKVDGLKHSGIIQIDYTKPASASGSSSAPAGSSSGGGGGGGAGQACISDWQCSEWSQCANGMQNRKCLDASRCAFPGKKPIEEENCPGELKTSVIKGSGYEKIIGRIKNSAQIKKYQSITWQAFNIPAKANKGIFIMFAEVVLIIGTYLLITRFPKMFK